MDAEHLEAMHRCNFAWLVTLDCVAMTYWAFDVRQVSDGSIITAFVLWMCRKQIETVSRHATGLFIIFSMTHVVRFLAAKDANNVVVRGERLACERKRDYGVLNQVPTGSPFCSDSRLPLQR